MTPSRKPALVLAGVDLIRDTEGRWRVLEVNDHPTGLARSDSLCATNPSSFDLFGSGVDILADTLYEFNSGQTVGLLLPECFQVSGPIRSGSAKLAPGEADFDPRIESTIREFNVLARSIRRHVNCTIGDVSTFEITGHGIVASDGDEISVLFRRASLVPPFPSDCVFVNDMRARRLCADKLRTFEVLKCLGEHGPPPTLLAAASTVHNENLKRWGFDHWVIRKPRWGAASRDVERSTLSEVLKRIDRGIGSEDMVIQPWVRPDTVCVKSTSYHFDLRLFVVDERVVGGFGRRAAASASANECGVESPLCWLTTLGPVLPLALATETALNSELNALGTIALSEQEATTAFTLATEAVRIMNIAADELDLSSLADIPSFRELNGVSGDIKAVRVVASNSASLGG